MTNEKTGCLVDLLPLEESMKVAEAAGVPAELADRNVFRLLLRRPALAKAVNDLLYSLLFDATLDDRIRELVIMRIGWATGSDYEWTQHWSVAQQAFGCSPEDLQAVRDWKSSDRFEAAARAALTATDETLETGAISRETFTLCEQHLGGADQCLELVASIGAWRLISQLARSCQIPLEDGVESWPPDGKWRA